ncbi:thioredoxin [Sulfurifustis variabilis]|uniref:Thioredoxin n=1 Tax=Sulfurifustis variabilis TaxID=1675686 RepID=A0A1B4V570_9GAMM|nr:thioredoxin [Sulfurifustis variabilis]BAU48683.1 thioredoxin [Sulfurifustis variabilis]
MADSPFIADVTQSDFAARVVEKSHEVPVLVDFWAAWCGPCQMLMPVLARLAGEYQGKFLLAKVNTDVEQALALEYGVRSLPTVKLFRHGQVVGEFMGVQPESAIRTLIDRFVPREADSVIERADALAAQGRTREGLALLRAGLSGDPQYAPIRFALARLLLTPDDAAGLSARIEEAEQVLGGLPLDRASDPETIGLRARLDLLRAVADAPTPAELEKTLADDPGNQDARYRLSAWRVLSGDYEQAMEGLLEIVRRDRTFRDDGARKTLVSVFNLLGQQHPLVPKYRARLSSALN